MPVVLPSAASGAPLAAGCVDGGLICFSSNRSAGPSRPSRISSPSLSGLQRWMRCPSRYVPSLLFQSQTNQPWLREKRTTAWCSETPSALDRQRRFAAEVPIVRGLAGSSGATLRRSLARTSWAMPALMACHCPSFGARAAATTDASLLPDRSTSPHLPAGRAKPGRGRAGPCWPAPEPPEP